MLENFAANILDGTPLLAPGSDGIKGVRLANAIHLSSWTGTEVALDFDEDEYLAGAEQAHRGRGQVPRALLDPPPTLAQAGAAVLSTQNGPA